MDYINLVESKVHEYLNNRYTLKHFDKFTTTEDNMPMYMALLIPKMWYDQKVVPYTIGWRYFQLPNAIVMSEQSAIDGLMAILDKYPQVAAWINYEYIHISFGLRWINMIAICTSLLEHRHLWFTNGGQYHYLSATDAYVDSGCFHAKRHDIPIASEFGPWCLPTCLTMLDGQSATINNDHCIVDWMLNDSSKHLRKILSRALACCVEQWGIEECESFHRDEQEHVLGIIHHIKSDKDTQLPYFWHSRMTSNLCTLCEKKTTQLVKGITLTDYEIVLYNAMMIRRRKIRGLLWCATRLLMIANQVAYIPVIGRKYKMALNDFKCLKFD